jgi:hypothetical protein
MRQIAHEVLLTLRRQPKALGPDVTV